MSSASSSAGGRGVAEGTLPGPGHWFRTEMLVPQSGVTRVKTTVGGGESGGRTPFLDAEDGRLLFLLSSRSYKGAVTQRAELRA